jgi:fibronectin type 3 domain-containing protein
LNPTIAITVEVQFDPTTAGAATGTLTFTSNSTTGNTSAVSLSGTGVATQHQVTLNWTPPINSPIPVTGYKIYRSTGSSAPFKLLNSSTATAYVDLAVVASATYTYYVTSVDSAGTESVPSGQVTVTIP